MNLLVHSWSYDLGEHMASKKIPAVNIQWPISEEIVLGSKTVETRTYDLPPKYRGIELAIIETPGPSGKFKARVTGIIIFENSFKYSSKKDFYSDIKRHRVSENSPWAWSSKKPKWGWTIKSTVKFKTPVPFKGKRGIVFSKEISFELPK